MIATKVGLALSVGLNVIFCIGEKLEERDAGTTQDVINAQMAAVKGAPVRVCVCGGGDCGCR